MHLLRKVGRKLGAFVNCLCDGVSKRDFFVEYLATADKYKGLFGIEQNFRLGHDLMLPDKSTLVSHDEPCCVYRVKIVFADQRLALHESQSFIDGLHNTGAQNAVVLIANCSAYIFRVVARYGGIRVYAFEEIPSEFSRRKLQDIRCRRQ